MSKHYAILGAGMQGTACAYDLAKHANPSKIHLLDVNDHQAASAATRVNELVGSRICEPAYGNALEHDRLVETLKDIDVLCSCVPYWMHPQVARACIDAGTSMVDLGGNTDITMETLDMGDKAEAAGVSLIPDCGLAPGLVNNLGCYCIEQLDEVDSIKLYCGVLPQNPKPPFNYKLTFNVEGLVTEYDFKAVTIRENQIHLVDTLSELEELVIDELGTMEAFVTSGGTSTAPYTFLNKVKNYEYKTIRFPGHCERIKIFKDFGFWNPEPVKVDDCEVIPRHLFYKVFGEALSKFEDKDMCAVRAVGIGKKGGENKRVQLDIFDRECEVTGFTSMERLTGFSQAVYAKEIADGNVGPGAHRYETAMTGTRFVEEIQKRDVTIKFS